MLEFLKGLFDSETFMPHGQCFLWYPEVLWLHVISDTVITLAYFSIPCSILYVIGKRKKLPFKWVYAMFGAFILLCGLTHLLGVLVLWVPMYRFEGIVKALTAGASIATAFAIIPIIPQLIEALEHMKKIEDEEQKTWEKSEKLRHSIS